MELRSPWINLKSPVDASKRPLSFNREFHPSFFFKRFLKVGSSSHKKGENWLKIIETQTRNLFKFVGRGATGNNNQ